MKLHSYVIFGLVQALIDFVRTDGDLWQQDVSDDVYIEASREGFENVRLRCLAKSMEVTVDMEEEFHGIFYTRGSYSSGQPPCFQDATGQVSVTLNIPFDECHTKTKDNSFVNTVILQHDDLLIFPGDTAFEISCNKSDTIDVVASIGLADPDPAAKELPKHKKSTVMANQSVDFTPDDIRPRRKKKKTKAKQEKQDVKDEL